MKLTVQSLAMAICSLILVGSAGAAEWGSLKGKFVVDGEAGPSAAINVNKDVEFCGKHDLVDETVVVGDDGGLANVVVYIYTKRGKSLDVHPDYAASASNPWCWTTRVAVSSRT